MRYWEILENVCEERVKGEGGGFPDLGDRLNSDVRSLHFDVQLNFYPLHYISM